MLDQPTQLTRPDNRKQSVECCQYPISARRLSQRDTTVIVKESGVAFADQLTLLEKEDPANRTSKRSMLL